MGEATTASRFTLVRKRMSPTWALKRLSAKPGVFLPDEVLRKIYCWNAEVSAFAA